MKTLIKTVLCVALIAALAVVGGYLTQPAPALAANTNVGYVAGAVGPDNIPYCVTFSVTDGGDSTLTVLLPKSFVPRFAFWFDNATAGDAPVGYSWINGMTANASATVSFAGASTAFSMDASVDTDAAVTTAGSFVIDADAVTDNHAVYGIICR